MIVGGFVATIYHKEQPKRDKAHTTCTRCLEVGHGSWQCANDIVCRSCHKPGHRQNDCQGGKDWEEEERHEREQKESEERKEKDEGAKEG